MKIPILGRGKPVSQIMVAVPTRGQMDPHFVYDLTMMVAHSTRAYAQIKSAELAISFCHGTYIDDQRNNLVKEALAIGVDAILWADDDMRFPRDALLRLARHRRPFVGVNYPRRIVTDCRPTAVESVLGGRHFLPPPDGRGLAPVEAIGFGLVLTHIDIFKTVEFPWFECRYDRELHVRFGEDTTFCERARAAGFQPEVDLELSERVRHVGRFEFGMSHARAYAEDVEGKG
jgi:hypothetical protein